MAIYYCRKCGKFFNSDVLSECPFCHEPVKKPKYPAHLTPPQSYQLDSAAFVCPKCGAYVISDKSKGENPQVKVSFIKYPKGGDITQVRLALHWDKCRLEQVNYNVKPLSTWRESGWLIMPVPAAEEIAKRILNDNPHKLENWM